MATREVLGLVDSVVRIPLRLSDVEYPSFGIAVDCILSGLSVVVAGDSVPLGPSDVEEPSLGVTDGGMLGRGLPSQGSLIEVDVERAVNIIFGGGRKLADLVIGHPGGSFSKADANFEELKS